MGYDQAGLLTHGSTEHHAFPSGDSGSVDSSSFTVAGAAPDLHRFPCSGQNGT